jgi:hypothetical protein
MRRLTRRIILGMLGQKEWGTTMRKVFGVLIGLLFCGCAARDGNQPHTVPLKYVPGAEPRSSLEAGDGASWTMLCPAPQSGVLFLQAWAGIGHKFPVQKEGGDTLFEVAVIQGNDDLLVAEVRAKEGTQTVDLRKDKPVSVKVAGITYELLYPRCYVSSDQNSRTTGKAMLIVTAPRP